MEHPPPPLPSTPLPSPLGLCSLAHRAPRTAQCPCPRQRLRLSRLYAATGHSTSLSSPLCPRAPSAQQRCTSPARGARREATSASGFSRLHAANGAPATPSIPVRDTRPLRDTTLSTAVGELAAGRRRQPKDSDEHQKVVAYLLLAGWTAIIKLGRRSLPSLYRWPWSQSHKL
ncbi:hypothetical protein BS50DRAFT_172880 [Corynespora cassiicola Philippines]|uniref:Uncharacterized protein n=1 Tax=Corynespora cassiicola Philippines TaxID=1448308 RepID=A0A2T2P5E0_CORCC|nr:hypothetical protein BS50DRAFT_172880 [Corynespora cassiicola Philippines]